MSDRPRSILGLLLRLAWLRRGAVLVAGLLVAVGVGYGASSCRESQPVRVATFNIEMLPKHPGQTAAAMQVIEQLDVPVVAIQEITNRDLFAAAIPRYLGENWRTVVQEGKDKILLGIAFDGDEYALESTTTHHETRLGEGQRPVLEVRLRPRRGPMLRLFVVHLKALDNPEDIDTRRRQLEVLAPIVRTSMDSKDDIVVLGDFNATSDADRHRLAQFATATGLIWASERLPCSAFWQPPDKGDVCETSRLDHVFTRRSTNSVTAHGPCEWHGCSERASCPAFHTWISDHCPIVVEW